MQAKVKQFAYFFAMRMAWVIGAVIRVERKIETLGISPGLRRRRISFLLIEAACQLAYMLFSVRV